MDTIVSKTETTQTSSRTNSLRTCLSQTETCNSCPDVRSSANSRVWENRFEMKPGDQFLFDHEGSSQSSTSLSTYIHVISAGNVFSTLFTHNQIVQKDLHKCSSSYHKNRTLNRFRDIPCHEDTRVVVPHPSEPHDYIHASWVDGYRENRKFIVAQSPMPHTMEHFWKMLWQEKALLVISMIQMYEVCPPETSLRYVPTKKGEIFTAGDFAVEHEGTIHVRETYDATILKVTFKGDTRTMLSMIYHDWDDKGSPKRPSELLWFIADMNYNRKLLIDKAKAEGWFKEEDKSPIAINCLAGTGRSCVIVALDIICRKMDATAKLPMGALMDVEDTVMRLRTQRAMAVQKPEQYLLLQFSSLEYAIRMKYISDRDFGDVDLEAYKHKTKKRKSQNNLDISTN